jgi:CRISPR-associated protein Csm3
MLTKYVTIAGTITCETGLRIGGSTENIEIGGMENPIIRHPLTDEPYIPGSSLKGKIRSLLEYKQGRFVTQNNNRQVKRDSDGEPCECGQCDICRVFGPHKNVRHNLGPTRALFRDAVLTPTSRETLVEAQSSKGIFFAEVKTENLVDRNTGTAVHPRTQERVPEGTKFVFEISVRIFDEDDQDAIINLLKQGLEMLEQDYLGSSGSRGYGKVGLEYDVTEINLEAA